MYCLLVYPLAVVKRQLGLRPVIDLPLIMLQKSASAVPEAPQQQICPGATQSIQQT